MATIKAGTYRFNDVLNRSTLYDSPEIDLDFTFVSSGLFFHCNAIRVPNANEGYGIQLAYDVSFTEPTYVSDATIPVYFNGVWGDDGLFTDDGYRTITIPNDTEVSAEFAEWFTANAIEQTTISGKWKFKDVLTAPSWGHQEVLFTGQYDFEGTPITANFTEFIVGDTSADVGIFYRLDSTTPTVPNEVWDSLGARPPFDLVVYKDLWLNHFGDYQTIDFGTEPQFVTAEFYNWLTANASQPCASITHNGEAIASLFPGQTATLKCAGMKMAGDVVVSVAEQTGGGSGVEMSAVVGRWKINNFTGSKPWKESAKFFAEVNGVTQNFIGIEYECDNSSAQGYYLSESSRVEVFNTNTDGFTNESIRTVDFGTEPQLVSTSFKTWLDKDASRLGGGVECDCKKVSGTWVFNDELTPADAPNTVIGETIALCTSYMDGSNLWTEFVDNMGIVSMKLSGTDYIAVTITENAVSLKNGAKQVSSFVAPENSYTETDGWVNPQWQTITFAGEQTVSTEFYNWLTKNATRKNLNTISGTWVLNDTVAAPDTPFAQFVEFGVNTTVPAYGVDLSLSANVIYFGTVDGVVTGRYYVVSSTPDLSSLGMSTPMSFKLYADAWDVASYGDGIKTITFAKEQEVSNEFYSWLTANATKQ